MPLSDVGRDLSAQAVAGETITPFNEANSYIGVGDGTAAFDSTHTDLQGASTERIAMDSGYPTVTDNELTYRSTFGTGDANFDWEEWGVFNASTGGDMLNRKVESLGTKPNTQSWQFTVTLTFSNA